jgi:hypothetical protein
MKRRKKFAAFVALAVINVALIGFLVIALELAFGDWFVSYLPPYGATFDRTHTYEQRLYEPHGLVTYVRDRYGLRGADDPIDTIELVTVGGSTTDQRMITEGSTWQDVIRKLTGIRIANAGLVGLSSSGHVVVVRDWLHRIEKLHPRFYLHYVGVNDAVHVRYLGESDPVTKVRNLKRLQRQTQPPSLGRLIRARSVLVRSYLRLAAYIGGPPSFDAASLDADTPEIEAVVDRTLADEYIESIYKPNLRRLIEMHRNKGEHAIIVSQPAHPSVFRWEKDAVFVRDPKLSLWAVALGMLNQAAGRLCREYKDSCTFFDMAHDVRFEPGDFYNIVHSTPAGAMRIGTYLAGKLPTLRQAAIP